MNARLSALLLAAALAGCSGGGTAAVQPAGNALPAGNANGTAIVSTITVPAALAMANARRGAQYVSASSLGLKIVLTDIPPAGGTASYAPATTIYPLGVGLNQIIVPTPASATGHTEDLEYITYNMAPVGNAIPGGAKALGWGLTTGFVVLPGQNVNNVVLSAVADSFPAPLAETGSFGMMSATPPVPAGAQTSLGFGGNAVPSGNPILEDAGLNSINAAAGGPWAVVGGLPATATAVATGVPVTVTETAGSCGAIGTGPHLKFSYNGGTAGTTATIVAPTDTIVPQYDGSGGAGWYAVVSAKGQTQTLTYTLSSLAATSTSTDYSCPNQTLSFKYVNETALITIVQHNPATPYTITEPATANCTNLVNVYAGNSTLPANLIVPGTPTSLGAATTFTIQLIPVPPAANQCNIEIQDANAAQTGGPAYPGATTYVAALLPSSVYQIIVP
jgi:hypothetical protein